MHNDFNSGHIALLLFLILIPKMQYMVSLVFHFPALRFGPFSGLEFSVHSSEYFLPNTKTFQAELMPYQKG